VSRDSGILDMMEYWNRGYKYIGEEGWLNIRYRGVGCGIFDTKECISGKTNIM
jgi:hypothetical protein